MKHPVLLAAALAAVSAAPVAKAQQPLPALPGPGDQAAPAASPAATAPRTAAQLFEHVRRGVVVLEKNGTPVALGTVLGSDGRILTALSGLGGGDGADVLYADGTTVHARLGNGDKGTDLALLVPQSSKWKDGLAASEGDPSAEQLHAMLPTKGAKLSPAEADVKGKAEAHTKEGLPLLQMLNVDVKGPLIPGAPLLDGAGNVAAVLVRACRGSAGAGAGEANWAAWGNPSQAAGAAAACAPVVVGAPVTAIRSFLTKVPAATAGPAPFLGIRGETEGGGSVHGVKVMAVAPRSPAEKAGLKASNDVIAAVDGTPVDSPEKLAEAIGKHAPGDTVKLLVFGQDHFREVAVVLRAAP